MTDSPRKAIGRPRQHLCKRGHNLDDPANVRLDGRGVRRCILCARKHMRDWLAAHKEQSACADGDNAQS